MWTRWFALVVLLGLVSACSLFGGKDEPPPPPPPTRVKLSFDAAANINPDSAGEGAPLQLRIYELKGTSAFDSADFFAIYDNDQSALGADLVSKKELVLTPGEKTTLVWKPDSGSQAIGLVAAYRKLDHAKWRAKISVAEHQTTLVDVKVEGTDLTVTPRTAPPPPKP